MPDIDAVLCDVHGVLYVHPEAIPGSPEGVAKLRQSGKPFRFLTNSTQFPKSHIVASLRELGIDLQPHEVLTSPEAAGLVLQQRGLQKIGWLCAPALSEDLPAADPVLPGPGAGSRVDAVLVGDMGPRFTYEVLNQAFRWLRDGAVLVALARNRFYKSAEGLVLDSGPFVRLLEDAAGTQAVVTGKPSPQFFEAGLRTLGSDPSRTMMVGDDLEFDVLAAMNLGIQGCLVRTGKFREGDLTASSKQPDLVVENLAEAVESILGP